MQLRNPRKVIPFLICKFIKKSAMKTLKITLAGLLFITASALSSCGKKCNGPHEHHGKHDCSQQGTTTAAPTATTGSSGT
jgi:hypothetical protein